jgi:hypothetical protein
VCTSTTGDGDERLLTVVVVRDKISGTSFASTVEKKGSTDESAVEQTVAFVRRLGHPKMIIKSDQEPSIADFSRAVARVLECQCIPEHSRVSESQSNGVAEVGVQIVEGMLRTQKLGLERRLGAKIPCAHPAMTWLVPHAADSVTKFLRGSDGKTAYERLKGKPCREEVVEFGECVLFKTNRPDEGKLAPRWEPALWLGKRWASSEHIVSTEDGSVRHCRAIQRVPTEQR